MHVERLSRIAASALGSLAGYTAIFAVLASRWLASADRAAPAGYLGNAADERLVVWVLAWVAHALASPSLRVVDANINHPASAQLTGTEHFATLQASFAPLYALTGNPLLAANLTVFATYPLAALAMQRLLLALGCSAGAAWVAGLIFALGPFRVPAHLHLLQYTNLFLPLVALSVTRLRDRPTIDRAAWLAMALLLAALSSYYMALMSAVAALLWGSFELLGRHEPRTRFALLACGAAAAAALVVLVVSLPWLSRPEMANDAELDIAEAATRSYPRMVQASRVIRSGGMLPLVLAGIGVVALATSDRAARRCAIRGLVLTVLAQLTAVGAVLAVGETTVPTPFALVAASPARFFRYPFRFAVLVGFGTALLSAAALQGAYATLGRWAGRASAAVVALALVATQGRMLPGKRLTEMTDVREPAYEMVARVTRALGPGPLLELPIVSPLADRAAALGTEVRSMLGATQHWLPLVAGFTGYQPPHRVFVEREIARLPDARALQRLVDMTHVRWLLLQPPERWPEDRLAQREQIEKSPGMRAVAARDGWVLLRVETTPRPDLGWYEAIEAGPRRDHTILGASLAAIEEGAALASVSGVVQTPIPAGAVGLATLTVRNRGTAPWPIAAAAADEAAVVRLVAEWWRAGERDKAPSVAKQAFPLPIDLAPKDEITFSRWLRAPSEPGDYDVRIRVEQASGATFSRPENRSLDARVRVVERAPEPVTGPDRTPS